MLVVFELYNYSVLNERNGVWFTKSVLEEPLNAGHSYNSLFWEAEGLLSFEKHGLVAIQ